MLRSAALGIGIRAREGRLYAFRICLRAKMTYVCVLILPGEVDQNSASHLPAGLQTPHAWILNPRDLKRKRAVFSGLRGAAGARGRLANLLLAAFVWRLAPSLM